MMKSQRGLSLIGFLIVLVVLGFFGFLAMKISPMYFQHGQLVGAFEKARKNMEMDPTARSTINRDAFWKDVEASLVVEGVDTLYTKDNLKIDGRKVSYVYQREALVISNLYALGKFKIEFEIK
jgi:hypothetical protein